MFRFLSANGAWVSCWYLGKDHNNTERGKVVKCSRHTNNTHFVVSTARGLKNIREVLLLKLWLRFVRGECLVWQSQPFGWMSLTDELLLDNSQCESRESKEEESEERKRRREKANEMGRRGGEWLSHVQVNERWKHKEAVWGCGGLNREDWQKQSSSTVGCLNLHRCCYTPSTPQQSPLMISNITQSFVIALEPNRHCSLWLTLIQLPRNSYPLQKYYSIAAWLGKRRRALILAKTDTLAATYFVCHNTVEEDLPASLFTGSRDVLWGDMKDWMAAPAFTETQLIMSAFAPACQGCINTYPSTRPLEHSHTHPNTNSNTCLRILTWTLTQAHRYTLGRHTQPIKRALFSHLMILKMLVFHWLKHSKQTWRRDPTNKQAQSVFSAVNTARWGMCDCFSAWVYVYV